MKYLIVYYNYTNGLGNITYDYEKLNTKILIHSNLISLIKDTFNPYTQVVPQVNITGVLELNEDEWIEY